MTGFQVPKCANCGHPAGAHKSSGSRSLRRVERGVCLNPGCSCREFVEEPRGGLEGGDAATESEVSSMDVMRHPGEPITREECPRGHDTHPDWAICAECGAELVETEYAPVSLLVGAVHRGDWFRQAWANAAGCSVEKAERAYETLGDITTSGGQ